jgi:uncharacterized protein with HEPN domain
MSPRNWQTRIEDMLTCIRNVQAFVVGMTYDEFFEDTKTIRAVAFELSILGEAARAMPDSVRIQYPEIPWGKMQEIRNVIIHEYYRIDEEILWKTIQNDLEPLLPQLESILRINPTDQS